MGKLVEFPIKTLFNGVSRQPHPVRLPNQIEEGDNTMPSVVTGGFEKRPATQHIKTTSLDPTLEYMVHAINRDDSERYFVVIGDEDLKVFALNDGDECTVTFPDGKTYFNADPHDHRCTTIADYTFIANRDTAVALAAAGAGSVTDTYQKFSDLPAASGVSGNIYKVQGDDSTNFDDYYVKSTGDVYIEWVKPDEQNDFNTATMPHELERTALETFVFRKGTWLGRTVGDPTSVPAPEFVGKTINDLFFYRGRLGLASDEFIVTSQAEDLYKFWPDKAFQTIDSDPVTLPAQTNEVSILKWAVPFRKTLFATALAQQFEVSAVARFTPESAVMDPTTKYQIDGLCRPTVMGDQLYFTGSAQGSGVVYEYFFDGEVFNNSAADITKHCQGYVPANIRWSSSAALSGRVFFGPDGERNALYVYTSYWDGEKKAQSAWTRYVFGEDEDAAYIYGGSVIGDMLYILIARGDEVCIEKMPIDTEADAEDMGFAPLYDRRVELTGVYDAGNGWTTWTTPYEHGDAVKVLLGGGFTNQVGRILNVTYPTATTVRATGNFSSATAFLGIEYEQRTELSRQYLRDENGAAIKTGRLQLRDFTFSYKKTGYFEVHVTPEARTAKTWKFYGRQLGSSSFLVGQPAIQAQGNFTVQIGSRGDTCKVEIVNSSPFPSVITGATWTGFYNNVVKQG